MKPTLVQARKKVAEMGSAGHWKDFYERHLPHVKQLILPRLLVLGCHLSYEAIFTSMLYKPRIEFIQYIQSCTLGLVCILVRMKYFARFWRNHPSKWPTKKSSFSSSANSQYFFTKISWIGPLVSLKTNLNFFLL